MHVTASSANKVIVCYVTLLLFTCAQNDAFLANISKEHIESYVVISFID